jgi:hypothetical protein
VKTEIEARFKLNLARVRNLIAAYQAAAPGQGRPDVVTTDILRAAVVFLHASLEDLLRSLLEWKLPSAAPEYLREVPLEGKKPRTTFLLDDLVPHRGRTVDEVIARSVSASLEESNFNHPGEVERVIERIGLPRTLLDPYRDKLGPMMQRRHWIVHRADRNTVAASGNSLPRSLEQAAVENWHSALEGFATALLATL